MGDFISVDEANFEERVLKAETPILLEFGAPWCRPCKSLEGILAGLEREWGGRVRVARLDVDACVELTQRYQIFSVPTTLLFIHGEEKKRFTGLQRADKLREQIERYLED